MIPEVLPTTETIRTYILRKDGLRSPNVVVIVSVDGREVCQVRPNGNGQFDTTPGEHVVEVKIIRGIRVSRNVTLENGSQIRIKTDLGKIDFEMAKVKFLRPHFPLSAPLLRQVMYSN